MLDKSNVFHVWEVQWIVKICRETANGNCKTLRNDEIIQYFCHEHRNNGNLIQNPLDKEAGITLFILKKIVWTKQFVKSKKGYIPEKIK